jgi:hypothetical protein
MSETPRTAEAKIKCGFQAVPDSFLQFARELELENEARRTLQHEYLSKIWKLQEEYAALRDDKARLDWLCEYDGSAWLYNYLRVTRCLCRKDIDAARKEAQP